MVEKNDREYELLVPPKVEPKPPGFTYTWAGERLGYLRGSVAGVVLGHREASKDMMFNIENQIGWKVTDQVRYMNPANGLKSHGKRLWEALAAVYLVEHDPVKEGAVQCPVCGVWNLGGFGSKGCWNCGNS